MNDNTLLRRAPCPPDGLFQDPAHHGAITIPATPPPSPLTRYVLHQLPLDIEAYSRDQLSLRDLSQRHTELLQTQASHLQRQKPATAAETQLDLIMLLNTYLPAKSEAYTIAPPLLLELLDHNSRHHHLPSRLTYELIVDVNTRRFLQTGHIRLFSTGAIAHIERDFYIGHYFAERHMRRAYHALAKVLQSPIETNARIPILKSVQSNLHQFTNYMAAYARLPQVEYSYFRRFLTPYPDRIKNASGAFMPSPQLFEMLLHGPDYAQSAFIQTNHRYFSRWAQPLLIVLADRSSSGHNLEHLLAQKQISITPEEVLYIHGIIEQFIQFKLTHIKVASSKIPEAFPTHPILDRESLRGFCPFLGPIQGGSGLQQGTGGFRPQDFLGDGIHRLLELQTRLLTQLPSTSISHQALLK